MEIFSLLYAERFGKILQEVRQVQTQLGEIHDCDVWIAFLPDFLEQERKRAVEYFGNPRTMGRLLPGIDHLRAERQRCRQACWRGFLEFWEDLRRQDTWGELYRMVVEAPPRRKEASAPVPPVAQELPAAQGPPTGQEPPA
jgi:hypothetical protein